MDYKTEFLRIWSENVTRQGSKELIEWLCKTDFFEAPASTQFHNNFEGGLIKHSLNVYERFECDNPESRAICALLHDLCKANFYIVDYRKAKNAHGIWEKVPYYKVDDKFPMGHGEKSTFMIERFMRLTIEEAMAIRWHMGGFDDSVKGGCRAQGKAFEMYPLVVKLHIADLQATYLDEN